MYTGLTLSGIYLPKHNFPSLKKVFSCKAAEVRVSYLQRKTTKLDLHREIHQIVGQEEDLGFTSNKLPNREWLINVLNYISPNHRYFTDLSSNQLNGFTQQDLQKLEIYIPRYTKQKGSDFLKQLKNKGCKGKSIQQISKLKKPNQEDSKRQTNMQGKLLTLNKQQVEMLPQVQEQQEQNLRNNAFSQNFNLQEEMFSE